MNPIVHLDEVIAAVRQFEGRAEDFALPIAETLFDPFGMNMALITDQVLARKWEPDGYEQRDGYRVFRYKSLP